MSILINGMEMPENCEECNLESFCDLWIDAKRMCGESFTDSKVRVKATIRHPNCPLIEVPIVHCCECKYNNHCLTQSFVEEESRVPFDRNTYFCSDGVKEE